MVVWLVGEQRPCSCGARRAQVWRVWKVRWSREAAWQDTILCKECKVGLQRSLLGEYLALRRRIRQALEDSGVVTVLGREFGEREIIAMRDELIKSMGNVEERMMRRND